jgi:hypothetical protein
MELKITHMMKDADEMCFLSGSIAELGDNAGNLTWENSQRYAKEHALLSAEQIEEVRNYFQSYGAWNDEEIASWSIDDVQALVTQEIAAEIREYLTFDSFEEYQTASEKGQASGRIFQDAKGEWYISFQF